MARHLLLALAMLAGLAPSCSNPTNPPAGDRTYRLGFSALSPQPTVQSVLATINAWRPRADVALVTREVPWKALLADTAAPVIVRRDLKELVDLFRAWGLPVIVQLDVTNGLSRDKESTELVELGRSIAEPAVQAKYREFLAAMDTILKPDYLGLAMETNLVRAIAPAPLYSALRTMVNAGATDLIARGSPAKRFISVQVETAWGRLPASNTYVGIATDRADFAFMQAIGLSSYPYLGGFTQPEDVPLDYYARIGDGAPALPMLVVEGGWSSASVTGVTSAPEKQARWIRRQMELADRASLAAVTQITYTDLDLSAMLLPPGSILPLFANLGLVDVNLQAKPALTEWNKAFARRLR